MLQGLINFLASGKSKFQLTGSILAKDPITGDVKELSALQDASGDWVLRTAAATQVAYDPDKDVYKIMRDNSKTRVYTILSERTIKSASFFVDNIELPDTAVGIHIICKIWGITGTIAVDEGISIRLRTGMDNVNGQSLVFDKTSTKFKEFTSPYTSGNTGIIVHPQASVLSTSWPTGYVKNYLLQESPLIGNSARIDVTISGTFEEGEGFDCEIGLMYL